jgi:DUF4097 and DUF4098 domain-containing protein YvlB
MQSRLVLSAVLLSFGLASAAAARGVDVDKVNGSIRIESGQQGGDLSTVNGSIHVESGAGAQKVSTVNGGIDLGDNVTVDALDTVNGSIDVGERAHVTTTVEAVNGGIHLRKGADVAGRASNVNGRFTLDAAHIGGGIETVAGDIDIGADSRIEGGIVVDKSHGWLNSDRKPRIVIGPRAVVDGTLEFRREVELYVSDSAKIGPVKGANAQKFSGDHP